MENPIDQYSSSQSSMRDKPKHFEAIKALVRIARESNVNVRRQNSVLTSQTMVSFMVAECSGARARQRMRMRIPTRTSIGALDSLMSFSGMCNLLLHSGSII